MSCLCTALDVLGDLRDVCPMVTLDDFVSSDGCGDGLRGGLAATWKADHVQPGDGVAVALEDEDFVFVDRHRFCVVDGRASLVAQLPGAQQGAIQVRKEVDWGRCWDAGKVESAFVR